MQAKIEEFGPISRPKRNHLKAKHHFIDVHVGKRLRMRRLLMGLSQQEIAKKISLTFQQVQKYERGTNRISASKLYEFAKMLNVPVEYFFEDLSGKNDNTSKYCLTADRETLELIRAYQKVSNPQLRKRVLELIRSMSE